MDSSTGRPVSHERWRLSAQWTGILAGPLVFLLLLEVHYVLAGVACETRETWFLHAATAAAVVIVAAAALWAWRASIQDPRTSEHPDAPERRALANSDDLRRERSAWMTALGVATCGLFILLILTFEIPISILEVCQ
jgi:lysylphosphatidylglycerol synthetase-like protein (DUF2156 family)